MKIVYTGPEAIEIPGLGFTGERVWPPGEAREVPDVYGERWLADPEAPYAKPGTKAARDAAGMADDAQTTTQEVGGS
jgi:hypothetical protein